MLVSRIDRLLARTDPFELSQALELHVRSLSGDRIRALLRAAGPRLGAYYRDEFARLTGSRDFETALDTQRSDAVLQNAFVKFLKSNLRAIPIFGNSFGLALLDHTPVDRAVGIGEERGNRLGRGALVSSAALALVLAGAVGEHVVAGARASAQNPQPVVMLPPAAIGTPHPAHRKASASEPAPKTRVLARVTATYVPTPVPQAVEAPTVVNPPPPPRSSPSPSRASTPLSGAGVGEVTAPPQTPTPQPSDIDVTDMPESYSDATPMPQQSPMTAEVPDHAIRVPTPKPSPKKHSWLHRTLSHLNPFKP